MSTENTSEALTHEQVRHLENVNRLKAEFLANCSHELRTPIHAIIGYAELLLDSVYGPMADEQEQTVRFIHESAQDLLDLVNKKVQEYDIRVAIHNHGPGDKVYPTPQSAYDRIKNLDRRIGLCIDLGHTQRSGVDPSEAASKYADRLFDIHIKDVTRATADGMTVEIGRGMIDFPKFIRTLQSINYQGTVALEYEKDSKDPLPGASESIGYLRGVMAVV